MYVSAQIHRKAISKQKQLVTQGTIKIILYGVIQLQYSSSNAPPARKQTSVSDAWFCPKRASGPMISHRLFVLAYFRKEAKSACASNDH